MVLVVLLLVLNTDDSTVQHVAASRFEYAQMTTPDRAHTGDKPTRMPVKTPYGFSVTSGV
jgi:hypothetical protein